MKKTVEKDTKGAGNRMKHLVLIMICAVGAMVWTFVQVGDHAGRDQSRMTNASEQMLLSQQLAKYARAAAAGESSAFEKLGNSKSVFNEILDTQLADSDGLNGGLESVESVALGNLDNRWQTFRKNIDTVLDGQNLIVATAEATGLVSEVMPQLMEHTRDVTNSLVKQGASPRQVRLASNQSLLGQRIVNSLNKVMNGNDTEAAAILFAADTKEFGRVLDGFKRGTGGITQNKSRTPQSKTQ